MPLWIWTPHGLCFALLYFSSFAQVPFPSVKEKALVASSPRPPHPGSGGQHSWHPRGIAHCPVSSGQGAASLARSSLHLPRSDSYTHTCACPVGTVEEGETTCSPGTPPLSNPMPWGPLGSIADVQKEPERQLPACLASVQVGDECLSSFMPQVSFLRGALSDHPITQLHGSF